MAPKDFATFIKILFTFFIPFHVLNKTGQKVDNDIIKTVALKPKPNHKIASGIHAILGIGWNK